MKRRTFLAGLTGAGGALLLPRRGAARRPPPLIKRLVIIQQNNGTQQGSFWPQPGTLSSPILDPILSDPRLASQTIAVRGIQLPHDANGTDANEHDMGFIRLWTGAPLLAIGNHPWGGAPSVDQLVAQARGVPSLALAIYTSSIAPYPKPGFEHRRSFSYRAPGVHNLPTIDPFTAYANLFWGGDALTPAVKRRLALRKSALDVAAADLTAMRARLSGDQARKLDAHADAVRSVENRLFDRLAGKLGPGATCSAKGTPPRDITDTTPDQLITDEAGVPEMLRDHLDLITAAFACNLTQVATVQIGYAGAHWNAAWADVGTDHHVLAHKDIRDQGGDDPTVTQKIVNLGRWHASQVAYLARKLDAIPDGHGTLLDNTLIVWSNEFGRGDHSLDNIPIVFVGGVMPSGGRVVDVGVQPFQRVGTSVLRAMGILVDGFGDAPGCGPLAGV